MGLFSHKLAPQNLDLHTKGLGSARNPPKRLGLIMDFMFFRHVLCFLLHVLHVLRIFCCFQGLDRVFLEIRSDRRYLYKDEKTM
ncbi:hypothetical protein LINGRAHAP2_LOCUS15544 [Linum grandiflorum]